MYKAKYTSLTYKELSIHLQQMGVLLGSSLSMLPGRYNQYFNVSWTICLVNNSRCQANEDDAYLPISLRVADDLHEGICKVLYMSQLCDLRLNGTAESSLMMA